MHEIEILHIHDRLKTLANAIDDDIMHITCFCLQFNVYSPNHEASYGRFLLMLMYSFISKPF